MIHHDDMEPAILPTTNADRIRAMSDEELAEWMTGQETAIVDFIFGYLTKKTGMKFDTGEITKRLTEIKNERLDWLKSPVGGGEDDG